MADGRDLEILKTGRAQLRGAGFHLAGRVLAQDIRERHRMLHRLSLPSFRNRKLSTCITRVQVRSSRISILTAHLAIEACLTEGRDAEHTPSGTHGSAASELVGILARREDVPNISACWRGSRMWRGLASGPCLQTRLGRHCLDGASGRQSSRLRWRPDISTAQCLISRRLY
jgi:hypothetical protein